MAMRDDGVIAIDNQKKAEPEIRFGF